MIAASMPSSAPLRARTSLPECPSSAGVPSRTTRPAGRVGRGHDLVQREERADAGRRDDVVAAGVADAGQRVVLGADRDGRPVAGVTDTRPGTPSAPRGRRARPRRRAGPAPRPASRRCGAPRKPAPGARAAADDLRELGLQPSAARSTARDDRAAGRRRRRPAGPRRLTADSRTGGRGRRRSAGGGHRRPAGSATEVGHGHAGVVGKRFMRPSGGSANLHDAEESALYITEPRAAWADTTASGKGRPRRPQTARRTVPHRPVPAGVERVGNRLPEPFILFLGLFRRHLAFLQMALAT